MRACSHEVTLTGDDGREIDAMYCDAPSAHAGAHHYVR